MIIVVEPQCRGFAHEQFNAAFLYGYCLAHPQSNIVFFAETEHIKCVKAVLESAKLVLPQLKFKEISIPDAKSTANPRVILTYFILIKSILKFAYDSNCKRLSFLSIYTYNLLPLKYLLRFKYKSYFEVHAVMHGTLEFIKRRNFSLVRYYFSKLLYFSKRLAGIKVKPWKYIPENRFLYEKLFKASLINLTSDAITYFVLRDDALVNLRKYLTKSNLLFKSIDLPYIIENNEPMDEAPSGSSIVFGTFGKGYNDEIRNFVKSLDKQSSFKDCFVFKIIGGDVDKDLDDYRQVIYPVAGRKFSRAEMKIVVQDVNYFVFFYESDSYELTTSGAFFDAVAYGKPVLFLKNNCFDYYFEKFNFGYRYENIESLIMDLPNVFNSHEKNYLGMLNEIKKLGNSISINRSYQKLEFTSI